MTREKLITNFIEESNRIENILRPCHEDELLMVQSFLGLNEVRTGDLAAAVSVFQLCSDLGFAPLRVVHGQNVRVGAHTPPRGGPHIVEELNHILFLANGQHETPYQVHLRYETLHPFMDGNGRSGRLLWGWQMFQKYQWKGLQLGFLHMFYYQTLGESR